MGNNAVLKGAGWGTTLLTLLSECYPHTQAPLLGDLLTVYTHTYIHTHAYAHTHTPRGREGNFQTPEPSSHFDNIFPTTKWRLNLD